MLTGQETLEELSDQLKGSPVYLVSPKLEDIAIEDLLAYLRNACLKIASDKSMLKFKEDTETANSFADAAMHITDALEAIGLEKPITQPSKAFQ